MMKVYLMTRLKNENRRISLLVTLITLICAYAGGAFAAVYNASVSGDLTQMENAGGGTTNFTYTVTLDTPVISGDVIGFTAAVTGDVDGADYTLVPAGGTIGETESSFNVIVRVNDDNLVENSENFVLTITTVVQSSASASTIGTGGTLSPNGTITNDDDYAITISAPVPNSAAEDSGTLTYTVAMTNPVDAAVSVDYTVSGSGANPIDGSDLTSPYNVATTLTFPQGDNSSLTFVVDPATDNLVEHDEGFTASLSNVSSTIAGTGITTGSANGTITNDDDYEITISAPVPNSAAEDTGTLTYTVAMTNPVDAAVSVDYTVAGSGANPIDGSDLTSPYNVATTLTFPQGDNSSLTFVVDPATDNLVENAEGFTASLSNVSSTIAGTGITTGSANGAITNDDDYAITISAPVPNSAAEDTGTLTYTVAMTNPVDAAVSVDYTVAGSGANPIDGSDLTSPYNVATTLTFPQGDNSSLTFVVDPATDNLVEHDEGFTASLSNVSSTIAGTGITTGSANGAITNDDDYAITISAPGAE